MSHSEVTVVPKSKKSAGSRASTTRRRTTKRPEIEFKSAEFITSEDDKMVEDSTQLAFPLTSRVIQPITPQETPISSFVRGVGKRSQKGESSKIAAQRLLGMFSPKLRPQDTSMAGGIEEVIAGPSTPVSQRKPIGGGRPPVRIRASETPEPIQLDDDTPVPEMEEIFSQELIDLKQKCNQVLAEVHEEFIRQRDAVDKVYKQATEAQSQAKGQLGLINSLMIKLTETAEKADKSEGALRETVEYVKSLREDVQREFSLLESKDKDPKVFSELKAELLTDANDVWVKIVNDKQAEMVSVLKGVIEDVTNDKIQQSEDLSTTYLEKALEALSQQLLKSGSEKINELSAEVKQGMEEQGDWVEKGQNEMDERITALEKWMVKAEGQFCHCGKDKGKKRVIEE